MMSVVENYIRISRSIGQSKMLWLCRKTDWMKLLQLPDIDWWQLLVAAACLVVVIWAILRLATRINEDVDPAEADREMLQALHDLRREGDLTEDEFRSIKNQIVGRLNSSWNVAPKTGPSAKIADRPDLNLKSDEISENVSAVDSEAIQKSQLASQSNQPESFASPTNVPEPPQDTSDLSEGLTPPESENSQGHTEAGPAKKTEE